METIMSLYRKAVIIEHQKAKNMKSKVNLSAVHPSKVFYGYIYPIYAKQFLFGNDYTLFAELVQESFILTPDQWNIVLFEWELKESILSQPI